MACVRTVTMKEFRGMNTCSGEMRVIGGSRARRGVHRQNHRASCNSLTELAGSDAGRGSTAGGSAHTSAAHAAGHKTDADPAKTKVKKRRRTPHKKEKSSTKKGSGGGDAPVESLWDERAQLDGGVPLPEDGVGFVDAVNVNIDLIRLTELLLRGTDEKSSKSLLERLLEMRYGKNARHAEETSQAVIDIPGMTKD
ncbi:MAG TPA: hypothetical protein VFB10_01890 [Candidatus Dormibacteraeota bacterium]|nr:hypothetical protein [Candidatus Dormibacteraeota bacterium]